MPGFFIDRLAMIHSNLFCMQAFISLVEKKSFSLAAIELDVQEYILQLAIKQLENKFNVSLFNWESFSIVLTESGMSIYEYFKLFDDELLILIEDFAED